MSGKIRPYRYLAAKRSKFTASDFGQTEEGQLFTNLSVAFKRKARAKRETEGDLAVASVWFVFYLLMILNVLVPQSFVRAAWFAALN